MSFAIVNKAGPFFSSKIRHYLSIAMLFEPYRISLEEYAYQTLNEKVRMDLFTN